MMHQARFMIVILIFLYGDWLAEVRTARSILLTVLRKYYRFSAGT